MKLTIPNIKEIEKPVWAHKPGFGMDKKEGKRIYLKQNTLEQGTTPEDENLLKKLGIKKGEKILAIAGYYASWASGLKKAGAKVDYSDVSKPVVNWVKKNVKTKFDNYIRSGYEFIPKKLDEYDWTFTYEACGGGRGLPVAYLRSMMNKKGGILMVLLDESHVRNNLNKIRRYPKIVKNLAKVYGTKFQVIKKIIISRRKQKPIMNHEFMVAKIFTNNSAREMAKLDLKVLDYTKNKKVINIEKDSKLLNIEKKELKNSLKRLNKLSKSHAIELNKEIEIK